MKKYPFLWLIPNALWDHFFYSPVVCAKISFRSHKRFVSCCRELGPISEINVHEMLFWFGRGHLWYQWDYFRCQRSQVTLYIQSLSVPLEASINILITKNTRSWNFNYAMFFCQYILTCTTSQHAQMGCRAGGEFLWPSLLVPSSPACAERRLLKANTHNDVPSWLFKLILYNSHMLSEQHNAASVVTHLWQNFLPHSRLRAAGR